MVGLALLAGVGVSVWGASRALQEPAMAAARAAATDEDAARAQQKIFRVMTGARDTVVLSEAEVNAFLTKNVDPRDWPFERSVVHLRDGGAVEIVGAMPVRRLVRESPLPFLADLAPSAWLSRSIWVTLIAHPLVERGSRRQLLHLDVRQVMLGRQPVPTVLLRLLLEPTSLRFVRLSLPESVGDVRVESGRAVIRPASSRGRT